MTTEELILGHFDRALTADQEKLLQERLSASPEARAMYEQHRHLDGYLNSDAMAIAPSAKLDEMTLAAALGVIPEAIGGSTAATWFSGKIVATIAAVIIGGGSIALFTTPGSQENIAPASNPSVVRTLPMAPAPASVPAPEVVAPKHEAATVPSETAKPAATAARDHAVKAKASTVNDSRKAKSAAKSDKLQMPTGTSTVTQPTRVKP